MRERGSEVVTIDRSEYDRLRRAADVLARIRAHDARLHPDREPLVDLVGGLIDSERTIQGILEAHVRRLEARRPTERPTAPSPARTRAG